MSLWLETGDADLPLSFLDHKVKVGNALVGCWLDRVLDSPLRAWQREGGDGKDGPSTQRIQEFLNGPRQSNNRRRGDGVVKREMREIIQGAFQGQPSPVEDHSNNNQARDKLKSMMDKWCALWFWPADEQSLRHA